MISRSTKRLRGEARIQAEFCDWMRANAPEVMFMSIPNEHSTDAERVKLAAMGLRKGAADVMMLLRDNVPEWIEFKTPRKKQTPAQVEFQAEVESRGMRYHLCFSASEAVMIVLELIQKGEL